MDRLNCISCLGLLTIIAFATGDVLRYLPQNEKKTPGLFDELKSLFDFRKFVKVNTMPDMENALTSGSMIETETDRVGKYMFKNCADNKTKSLFDLTYLNFSPDPLSFPGTFTVSFLGTARKDINSPVLANVTLARKAASQYVRLPCVAQIGSCVYEDLCQLLDKIATCPPPLTAAGINCKCPIAAGNYKLKQASFDVQSAFLPTGDYMARANMTQGEVTVGCYEIYVSFA